MASTAFWVALLVVTDGAPSSLAPALIGERALPAPAAKAQSLSKSALRGRQDLLFKELLERPDDPRTMLEFARVSALLENHEGAIATLQRLLLFRPDDTEAKVELGALYFAIGSYAVSRKFFDEALLAPDLDDATRARIDRFRREIDQRTAVHRFDGEISVGVLASSNSTFGPDGASFDALDGSSLTVSAPEQADVGGRLRIDLLHSYDLKGPDEDRWETDATFDGRWWSDPESLNFAFAAFRTGPQISLDPRINGFKLRPFAELGVLSVDDRITYFSFGGGAEASVSFSDRWAASGELRLLWRDFRDDDDDDLDGLEGRLLASLRYAPTRNLALRATGLAEREDAETSDGRSTAGGVILSAALAYDAPVSWSQEKWTVDAIARAVYRRFDASDPLIETGDREHVDLSFELRHRFQIDSVWALVTEIEYQVRDASSSIEDFDAITGGVSVAVRF